MSDPTETIKKSINSLARTAGDLSSNHGTDDAADAMKLSQAALNLAHTLVTLKSVETWKTPNKNDVVP